VLELNPVSYNWKSEATDTPPHTGFIAQQVLPIMPDLVSQGPDGYYTLNYAGHRLCPYAQGFVGRAFFRRGRGFSTA
jgi:Chaperone of endosialidase